MSNNFDYLVVCIDSNVFVSAIAFGGKPLEVLSLALNREFSLVLGSNILEEVTSTLIKKIGLDAIEVEEVMSDFVEISTVLIPR